MAAGETAEVARRLARIRVVLINTQPSPFLERTVPERARLHLDGPRSTCEEVLAIRSLMRERGWRHVLVVSDPPHMRRLTLLWDAVFAGSGLAYTPVAARTGWWGAERWWEHGAAASAVRHELRSLLYQGLPCVSALRLMG